MRWWVQFLSIQPYPHKRRGTKEQRFQQFAESLERQGRHSHAQTREHQDGSRTPHVRTDNKICLWILIYQHAAPRQSQGQYSKILQAGLHPGLQWQRMNSTYDSNPSKTKKTIMWPSWRSACFIRSPGKSSFIRRSLIVRIVLKGISLGLKSACKFNHHNK